MEGIEGREGNNLYTVTRDTPDNADKQPNWMSAMLSHRAIFVHHYFAQQAGQRRAVPTPRRPRI
jgi:hypothetical protein